jgi:NitT/TauT family transport system substrate-binding protein
MSLIRRLCVVCVLCGLLVSCDSKQSPSSSSSTQKVSIQLNWKPEPQFGGFYAARDVAAKHGLEIEVVPGGVGTPTVQMVAAGKVPYAVVSADEVVIARSNGADVVALLAVYQTNPQGLMAHASRGLKSIGDIFAQPGTVAMQKGLPYASFLEKKFGFDKVKIVPSPGGDLSAFRADPNYTMQCFVTSEPLAAKKAGLDAQTFLIAEAGYNPYTTVLVTRGETIAKDRKQVDAVVAAVRDGLAGYLADPLNVNAAMQKLNPTMDAETFAAGAEAQKPLIATAETAQIGVGGMTLARWEELCRQLVELKVIEKAPNAGECFLSSGSGSTTKP